MRGVSFTAYEPPLHFADPSRFWQFRENPHFFKMASASQEPSTDAVDLEPVHTDAVHSQSEVSVDCVLEDWRSLTLMSPWRLPWELPMKFLYAFPMPAWLYMFHFKVAQLSVRKVHSIL